MNEPGVQGGRVTVNQQDRRWRRRWRTRTEDQRQQSCVIQVSRREKVRSAPCQTCTSIAEGTTLLALPAPKFGQMSSGEGNVLCEPYNSVTVEVFHLNFHSLSTFLYLPLHALERKNPRVGQYTHSLFYYDLNIYIKFSRCGAMSTVPRTKLVYSNQQHTNALQIEVIDLHLRHTCSTLHTLSPFKVGCLFKKESFRAKLQLIAHYKKSLNVWWDDLDNKITLSKCWKCF